MKKLFGLDKANGGIVSMILKVVGSSMFLTILNYGVNLYGLSVLDEKTLATIVFIQSYLVIGLQVGMSGYNYEILRFGTLEKYIEGKFGLDKLAFRRIFIVSILYVTITYFFVDTIRNTSLFLVFIPLIILVILIVMSGSILRSLQEYLISNIIDKFIVTSSAIAIVTASLIPMDINQILLVYVLMSVLTFVICLLLIQKRIPIKKLYAAERPNVDVNIRNNLYLGSVLILVVFEVQNIFIAEKISLEQLSLWSAYMLLFFPFKFFARNIHQILFPELANTRMQLSKSSIVKYLLFIAALSVAVFLIGAFPYRIYYEGKYEITFLGVFLTVFLGFTHMFFSPIGVYLGAKCSSKTLFLNNMLSLIVAICIMIYYYFNISLHFPFLLIVVLTSYWFMKSIFGIILIKRELR